MEELSLQEQVAALNTKVDILLGYVNQQRLKTVQLEDLIADLSIIGKDMYDTAVEELDRSMVRLDPDSVKQLLLGLLRNVDNLNRMMGVFESLNDFVKDASPILNEVVIDFSKKLHEFDQKGYFEFFGAAGEILDNIITHYSPEDVKELANNAVMIVDTLKSATQPEMMLAINNGLRVYRSMETDNIPEYSLFRAFREVNKPEMKRALGFFITFMKNMAAESNKTQT